LLVGAKVKRQGDRAEYSFDRGFYIRLRNVYSRHGQSSVWHRQLGQNLVCNQAVWNSICKMKNE